MMKPTDLGRHPLFQRMLRQHWMELPDVVRDMHDFGKRRTATGSAKVERGTGILANSIAWLFGLPKAADLIPVRVTFERNGTGEIWTRRFADVTFATRLDGHSGTNHDAPMIIESFGPLAFSLELHLDRERLYLSPVAWRLVGIPLPMLLAPYGNSYEFADNDKFAFHIEICVPIAGLIVRYHGTLDPVSD